jgi:site-specific DNA recombinase
MAKEKASTAKRAALYVRVSSEEQVEGYSLPAQRRAIEDYCRAHGYAIVQRYADEGKSGRGDDLAKRPAFKQMLDDADAGRFDVVIVHKNDRFARNRRVAFDAFHRLGSAGVGFVSIVENMDYSTPAGQLMLTMLVGLSQFYSDNLSAETKKGKAERKRQGYWNGLLPFGVTTDTRGIPCLDRSARYCDVATRREVVPADGLLMAYEPAAGGQSDREIAKALNDAGYRTSGNRGMNRWSKDSVRPMLQNRFYVGELPDGVGDWLPAKHGPFIDLNVFERAQLARERNATRPRRVTTEKRSPWALSGVATCACGATMTAYGHASGRQRVQCSRRTQTKDCDAPTFFASVVEEQLGAFLQGFAIPEEERARLVAAWRERQENQPNRGAERAAIQRKLARIRDLYEEGDLDKATYQAKRAALHADLAALPECSASSADAGDRLAAYLNDVALAWRAATPEERNKLARQMFNAVTIDNRTAVEITPRPDLRPFFATLAAEPSSVMTYGRKRRGSVSQQRHPDGYVWLADAPERRPVGRSRRAATHAPRLRKLSPDQAVAVRALAMTKSLRSLAADFGVSHETIRTVVRQPEPA